MATYRFFMDLKNIKSNEKTDKSVFQLKDTKIVDIMDFDGDKIKKTKKLQYFKLPSLYPLNLNKNVEKYIFRKEGFKGSNLKKVEHSIIKKNITFTDAADEENMQYICTQRGLLANFMMVPYTISKCPQFYATHYKNVLYLITKPYPQNKPEKRQTHHFKLRQYCFSDSPNVEANTDVPYDENQQTYCVYESKLQNLKLIYSGEISGVVSEEKITDFDDIEALNNCNFTFTKLLKTHQFSRDQRAKQEIRKDWAQAKLANVPEMWFGIKDANGLVLQPPKKYITNHMPNYFEHTNWSLEVSSAFLHELLNKVQKLMSHTNCPYTVYDFKYDSKEGCITYRVYHGKNRLSFLSEEFIKFTNP